MKPWFSIPSERAGNECNCFYHLVRCCVFVRRYISNSLEFRDDQSRSDHPIQIMYKTNVELIYTRECIFIAHDPGRINLLRSVLHSYCVAVDYSTVVGIAS